MDLFTTNDNYFWFMKLYFKYIGKIKKLKTDFVSSLIVHFDKKINKTENSNKRLYLK